MDPIAENKKDRDAIEEEAGYQKKLISTSFKTRVISLFATFLCANVLRSVLKVDISSSVMILLLAWMATCGLYLLVFNSKKALSKKTVENIHFSYYLPALLFASSLVHYLGGVEWVAFSFYIFDLIYANMLLKRVRGRIVTASMFISYCTVLLFEYYGIIPHYRLIPMYEASYNNTKYIMSTGVLVTGIVFFLLAYVMRLFSKMREDRERELLLSKEREELRTRQFEELSNSLKARMEENSFLKSRTMDYIRDKEGQLGFAKEDLERQVDALRKTQKAMQFMIEDLNEMSRELKKIKDHLEEKVEERTGELMRISDKLHRSEKLAFMGKLSGSVTHELRNPMAVIKNAVYCLESKIISGSAEKSEEYFRIIKKEVTAMDFIIEDIMGFARQKPVKLERTDLRNVVEEVLGLMEVPELIRITKEFEEIPHVMADGKQLAHAVSNIAQNAIMAMKGNGVLSFNVGVTDGNVCLKISDMGGGIPEEYRELIFEPLYGTKPKGTGLGLPIAKMMVESQNGKIEVSSQVGVGSTFSILMPMSDNN